jgi:serine/threonine protein kinase
MDDLDEFMLGKVLDDNWKVIEPRHVERDTTTANRTYVAQRTDGRVAFVKVLDPRGHGSLEEQEIQLQQFRYESEILEKCGTRHMRRVVRALTSGELRSTGALSVTVRYLVFEWAESDVRSQTDLEQRVHVATSLRWLHHMATALQELHFSSITHHDVRPANVLIMTNRTAKLGDLGHACDQARPRPGGDCTPDPSCAPPELLYGGNNTSIEDRFAADMYALGSLAIFLFTGVGLNVQMARHMPEMHHWSHWRGSFKDALLHIRAYYDLAIDDFASQINGEISDRFVDKFVAAVRWLTDPDPALRGEPTNKQFTHSPFNLERFISLFNVLASDAERHLAS